MSFINIRCPCSLVMFDSHEVMGDGIAIYRHACHMMHAMQLCNAMMANSWLDETYAGIAPYVTWSIKNI